MANHYPVDNISIMRAEGRLHVHQQDRREHRIEFFVNEQELALLTKAVNELRVRLQRRRGVQGLIARNALMASCEAVIHGGDMAMPVTDRGRIHTKAIRTEDQQRLDQLKSEQVEVCHNWADALDGLDILGVE